jgi:heavy metal efflux system protein
MDLKTIHEWQIKNQLRTVAGVNEINTWGGETRQYQLEVDPARAQAYGLTLRDMFERVQENNENFGGGFIEHSAEQYTVRGLGRANERERPGRDRAGVETRNACAVEGRRAGVYVGDATPGGGAARRQGRNGFGHGHHAQRREREARYRSGENEAGHPESSSRCSGCSGFYDQSSVIDATITTVRRNLLEGGGLVILVLLLFLGNVRAALVVAGVIPLSMLIAFIGMRIFGVTANLMSLGAIDFGMIVDGAVVMVENSIRRLSFASNDRDFSPMQEIREGAHEVARPILYAVAIIVAVYMPIFFLEGSKAGCSGRWRSPSARR